MTFLEIAPDRSKEFEYFPEIIDNLLSLLPSYTEELFREDEPIYSPKDFRKSVLETLDGHLMKQIDRETLVSTLLGSVKHFLIQHNFNQHPSPSTALDNPYFVGFKKGDIKQIRNSVLHEISDYLQNLETNYTDHVINLHDYLKEYISLE